MSSTKKTSSTQITTPNAPAWLSPQTQTLQANTANLANADPSTYVAPANSNLTQAGAGAGALTQDPAAYGVANGTFNNLATAGANTQNNVATVSPNTLLSHLDNYMSPYLNDVVSSTMGDYDRTAGTNRNQQVLNLAGMDDTFGGSGGQAYLGNYDAANALNRAQTESGLLNQGYTQAANLSNLDADRRQQAQLANQAAFNNAYQFNAGQEDAAQARQGTAAQNLINSNQTQNADQRANIATQGDIGSILQQIQQAQAGAPLTVQQAINSAYGSLLPADQMMTGSTTTGTSKSTTGGLGSALGSLGSLAMGLGSLGFAPFTGGLSLAGLGGAADAGLMSSMGSGLGSAISGAGLAGF